MTAIFDPETNTWRPSEDSDWRYANLHPEMGSCSTDGCMIHNPDADWIGNVENWPYSPRADGRMERICPHGVGHADPNSTRYLESIGYLSAGVHGCDLVDGVPCCQRTAA